jgi:tRNA pseudouridine55 synthase
MIYLEMMEGILNIDKPGGMTSHDVVNRIRRLAGIRRVGHAGTLDPLATGVLLICLGRTTRLVEYLIGHPKTYEATIRLGQTTNTYDADGEVTDERAVVVTRQDIMTALARFRGPIQQRPPMYSALKKNGQPLYKLARQGKEVERPLRQVTLFELKILQWQSPYLSLCVTCSAGTYIRSLAHDLGNVLGCGGHITTLRRTKVESFDAQTAVPLAELTADNLPTHLLPGDMAVQHLPRLDASQADTDRLLQGQPVPKLPTHPQSPLVRVYNPQAQFIGVVYAQDKHWQARKMFPPT